ncbi:MAG: hypothetical protein GY822_09790 [Deltaproteobacteria bacterium]|nr:hypothetical protein [Deltaproteobacteria bacterium]
MAFPACEPPTSGEPDAGTTNIEPDDAGETSTIDAGETSTIDAGETSTIDAGENVDDRRR